MKVLVHLVGQLARDLTTSPSFQALTILALRLLFSSDIVTLLFISDERLEPICHDGPFVASTHFVSLCPINTGRFLSVVGN